MRVTDFAVTHGSEFETSDGRWLYIVVVTGYMWKELLKVTGIFDEIAAIESGQTVSGRD